MSKNMNGAKPGVNTPNKQCPTALALEHNTCATFLAKFEATLIARLVSRDFSVPFLEVRGFVGAHWNLALHRADLTELAACAQKVGMA